MSDPIQKNSPQTISRPPTRLEIWSDFGFRTLATNFGRATIILTVTVLLLLGIRAFPAIQQYGAGFLVSSEWNPNQNRPDEPAEFGIAPAIVGTLYTSTIALAVGGFFGITAAVFTTQGFLPPAAETFLKNIIELLVAIPSVVYGLWGLTVIVPLFGGFGIFPAALVLAIMITPTITAISREAIAAVPVKLRDAAYGLGATRWETIFGVTLPTAVTGIFGSLVLAYGRALGETMALAMLIGNKNVLTLNPLSPSNTLAALLANKVPEADDTQLSALMYAGLVLLLITLFVNVLGTLLLNMATARLRGGS